MAIPRRSLIATIACLAFLGLHWLGAPAPAAASNNQVAIIEDDFHLLQDPVTTLQAFRRLGADMVRVFVDWSAITPGWQSPTRPNFNAGDPGAYPLGAWDRWDAIDRAAAQQGIQLDFVLTGGAPRWADGPGLPSEVRTNPYRAWYPSASAFGDFVHAVGTRYSGSYPDPGNPGHALPRVTFWSIWNEPNFGEDLGPQAIRGSTVAVAPGMYRGLVNSAWQALQATGHGRDRIVIGEVAARGQSARASRRFRDGLPGNFGQTKPLAFIRTLYCVDGRLHALQGAAAKAVNCPTTRAASRRFRAQNPGLFNATGFGDHPYPQNQPPTRDLSRDPDFAAFSDIPNLESELDGIARWYGSRKHLAIYNDEYGYITNPPHRGPFVSPATGAFYINWAEYLSWKSGRIASTAQYLLYDPTNSAGLPEPGGFASGLLTSTGRRKPAYDAYRLPLFLPTTTGRRGRSLEVWGGARPAAFAARDTHTAQFVRIQFRRGARGPFKTIRTVKITNGRGYFDTRVTFPASGAVQLAWTFPKVDLNFTANALGVTVFSRIQPITIR